MDENSVDLESDSLSEIVYRAVFDAVHEAIGEADLEQAIIEGVRMATDEILEQFSAHMTWIKEKREN